MIYKEYKSLNIRIGLTLLFHFTLNYFLLFKGDEIMWILGYYPDSTLVSVINSFLYLFCFMLPVLFFRIISVRRKKTDMGLGVRMNAESAMWIPAGIGLILAAAILNNEAVSFIDYSVVYSSETLDTPWAIVLDMIGTAIVPAVCEEFLFRGCIESNLLPYGKQSAIFVSALLFAMMHGNFIQFFYTFCAGLVLGFVYAETGSIWPGMFIHLFNNFVSTIEQVLTQNLEAYTANLLFYLMDGICLLAGLVFIVVIVMKKNGKILRSEENVKLTHSERLKSFFNPAIIIYLVFSVYDAAKIVYYTIILA